MCREARVSPSSDGPSALAVAHQNDAILIDPGQLTNLAQSVNDLCAPLLGRAPFAGVAGSRIAIALDPQFAEAYAGIAKSAYHVWRWDSDQVMSGPVAKKLAYESAGKVLELDPENPAAYGVLANLQVTDGRHEIALESARKAVSLAPNDAAAYEYLTPVLVYAGRHEEALEAMETAFRLDPKPSPSSHGRMGWVLFFHRRYEEAIGHLEKTREAIPWDENLAMAYAELGRLAEANAAMDDVFEDTPFANLAYYRNPQGTPQEHNEYVRVALRAIYHFSMKP